MPKEPPAASSPFRNPDDVRHEKPAKNESEETKTSKWWLHTEADVYRAAIPVANTIEESQKETAGRFTTYELLYGDNRGPFGRTASVNRFQGASLLNAPRLTLNVIQSCIDTLASKIAKSKPKPQFVPNDGDFKLHQKAKMLTDYLEGVFDFHQVYPLMQRVFTDSCIYGVSGVFVNKKFGELSIEYVLKDELLVDEMDGFKEKPRQLHLKRFVSRSELQHRFPEKAETIAKLGLADVNAQYHSYNSVSDLIVCLESWHLPSAPDADDGKHAICVENCTLLLEDYTRETYPIVFYRPYHKPHSFHGRGIAETLYTIQISINKLLKTVQQSQDLVSVPRVLLETGSQVNADLINDRIGSIIEYAGTPPQFISPTAVQPEIYSWIQYLVQQAYQISGVSESSAAGQKPKGVESAVAMREVEDIETGRFEVLGQQWEDTHIELGNRIIDVSKELYQDNPALKVRVRKYNLIKEIEWRDINFKEEQFSLQCFPISQLPHSPAGRIDTIEAYVQAGYIDKVTAMALLDMPDLSEEVSLQTGTLQLTKKMIGEMLDSGEYQSPVPQMDLTVAANIAKLAYVNAKVKDYPEDRLALVERFINDCKDMLDFIAKQSAPPPGPPGMPPQGAPPAPPMPPPQ